MKAFEYLPYKAMAWGLFLALTLSGCVSMPPTQRPPLTTDLYGFFKPCAPSDGGHALQLSKDDQLVGNAEVQWLASSGDNWDIEVNNTFGQRLGRWSLKQKKPSSQRVKLHQDSNILKKLPPVELDPQGFIHVDGHQVALKGDEIPCILGGYAPLNWASSLVSRRSHEKTQVLEFDEPGRSMEVSIAPKGGSSTSQEVKVCARVQWSRLLFWRQEMTWCAVRLKKAAPTPTQTIKGEYPQVRVIEVSFRGYDDYSMRLIPLEDSKTSARASSKRLLFSRT